MNKNIEIVFKEEVYCDWELFKRVIEAITKNKIKSISDWKISRMEIQHDRLSPHYNPNK